MTHEGLAHGKLGLAFQEQQTRACSHISKRTSVQISEHDPLTATSAASTTAAIKDINESRESETTLSIRSRSDSLPVNTSLWRWHEIRAQRCTHRLIVDKSHKNATTPISSLCCIPRTASLPNAPWSGTDLASASQTAYTDAKRSKREMQLAGILATTSLVPDRRPCVHSSDCPLQTPLNAAEMLPTVRTSPCFYCLRRRAAKWTTLPSAELKWNSNPSAQPRY